MGVINRIYLNRDNEFRDHNGESIGPGWFVQNVSNFGKI